MHTVNIRIGSHNHLVVTQSVQPVFNIQGSLQEVELLVLIHHLLRQSEGVERFATQREDGLCVHITALRDTAAGGITFSDKDATLFLPVVLHIRIVDTTVA